MNHLVNQCQKLYFIDYSLKTILYSDESDYAHGAYLCQDRVTDGITTEEPIKFLGGTFHQTRWSTIEKEAHATYWALLRLDDLIGVIPSTIRMDLRNLLFMNNYGLRKVLQWILDVQHYDAIIEHVPGKENIPADVFSLSLVVREQTLPLFHIHPTMLPATARTYPAISYPFRRGENYFFSHAI